LHRVRLKQLGQSLHTSGDADRYDKQDKTATGALGDGGAF